MDDDAFIARRLSESGILADSSSIQMVKNIAVHGRTGMKDSEICALTTELVKMTADFASHASKAGGAALAGIGAVLGVVTSIFKLVSDLQDRAETNEIAKQHLQGLDAAIGLAPESIRIVAAVKQIVQRGFDEHELRSSDADTSVTVDFLANKIRNLAQNLDQMDGQTISDYHKRLVARIDIHRKNTHMDIQRFSQGVGNMTGDYHINTNHLVHYSNACVLDAFLGYYELLLSYRLRDGLVQHNLETFSQRNKDAITTIEQALESYTKSRVEMVRTHAFYDAGAALHKDCVRDNASPNDQILAPINMVSIANSITDWNGCGMIPIDNEEEVRFWSAVWISGETTNLPNYEYPDSKTHQPKEQVHTDVTDGGMTRCQGPVIPTKNDHAEFQAGSHAISQHEGTTELEKDALHTARSPNENEQSGHERPPDYDTTLLASSTDDTNIQAPKCSNESNETRQPDKTMRQKDFIPTSNSRRSHKLNPQQPTPNTSAKPTFGKQGQDKGSVAKLYIPIAGKLSGQENDHSAKSPKPPRAPRARHHGRTALLSERVDNFLIPACVSLLVFAILQSPAYIRSRHTTFEQECHALPIYALIGKTGVGKSSFIKALGGKNSRGHEAVVCHSMDSCTSTIDYFKVNLNGQTSCILDTPGFDDNRPNMSDEEIMRQLFFKLLDTFDGTKLIKGLVYMHDISQTRMGGLASRHFQLFEKLCGHDNYGQVALTTTKWLKSPSWDEEQRELQRESELRTKYWKNMTDLGSHVERWDGTEASARRVLSILEGRPTLVRMPEQQEVVKQRKWGWVF
ncbi:hypothetical protein KCV07_g3194, partial [Aureobasidium melanogenum]